MGKTALKAGEIRDTYKQSEVFCLLAVTSAPPTSTPPHPRPKVHGAAAGFLNLKLCFCSSTKVDGLHSLHCTHHFCLYKYPMQSGSFQNYLENSFEDLTLSPTHTHKKTKTNIDR